MKDPYEEVFKEIGAAFKKQTDFIIELAKRTLSAKEFEEYFKTVNKKVNGDGDKDGQGKSDQMT